MMEEDLLVEKAYTTPTRANSVPLHLTSAWIIAQEFVEDENYSTLPWRLTRLCERLQQWIQHPSVCGLCDCFNETFVACAILTHNDMFKIEFCEREYIIAL